MPSMFRYLPSIPAFSKSASGIWFLAFLSCIHAVATTSSGKLLGYRGSRILGAPLDMSSRKKHLPGEMTTELERPNFHIFKVISLSDLSEETRNKNDIRENSESLATLKLISKRAQENRKNSLFHYEIDSSNPLPNFPHKVLTLLYPTSNSSSYPASSPHKRISQPFNKKIFVYGKDDRLRIFPPLLRKFPYSNIVRLSTGCTGTLLTPVHVLTAAHCVHTGYDFRNNLEMLKVEIPDTMGDKIFYIEKIGVPSKWLHTGKHELQVFWDYAVIKLSFAIHGRSQFFPLAVPTSGVLNQDLHFLGFPNNEDSLWMSICPANSNKVMADGNLILSSCDSDVGNSGSAILSDDSREGKRIIGVLSSVMPVGRWPHYTRLSIITALTWTKLYDICAEMGEIGVMYRVCPPLESTHRPRKIDIIPFFG